MTCIYIYTHAITSVVRWDGTDRYLEVEKPDKLVREHTSSCQVLESNKHLWHHHFKIWVNPSRDGANASYQEITYSVYEATLDPEAIFLFLFSGNG